MADNNNDQFKFDLDAKEALAQLGELRERVVSIGDSKNLAGLVRGLVAIAGPVAALGAALLATKAAFSLAQEGEQIEKIHRQFEAFADTVGVNSEKMGRDIQKSIGTTEDLDDALKSAKKSMSLLGSNSDKIPQFFEIAKKAADTFGGTMNERFDQISTAVARGNAGMLRQIGITIDSEKALKAYAASIGTTVAALSEQGRQAAIANAVLAKAQERYKNIKTEQDGIETSTKRFSATWKEAGDSIALAMNKAFGPAFSKAIDYFNEALKNVSTTIKANFGEGLERAEAQTEKLRKRIAYLNTELEHQKKIFGEVAPKTSEYKMYADQLEAANKQLANQEALTSALAEEERKRSAGKQADAILAKDAETKAGAGVDLSKKLDQENKFSMELLKISEQRINSQMEIETNADEYRMLQVQLRNNTIAQYDATIAETKRQGLMGETITKAQADQIIIQMEAEKAAKIEEINRDMANAQLKVYDNQVKAARTANEGIKAAFAQGAAQAQLSMKDYGKQGQMVFGTLTKNAASAFRALGDGSKSAGDAMKGFLMGSIADIAEAQGQFLLASGIGTSNAIQIAQGGALIALAGLLRSQSGDAGGGAGGSSGGGGGGGGGAGPGATGLTEKPEMLEDKKKSVTVQVMGSYFETEQTKTRLLEMIRQGTDGTDFKYQQIGVGG